MNKREQDLKVITLTMAAAAMFEGNIDRFMPVLESKLTKEAQERFFGEISDVDDNITNDEIIQALADQMNALVSNDQPLSTFDELVVVAGALQDAIDDDVITQDMVVESLSHTEVIKLLQLLPVIASLTEEDGKTFYKTLLGRFKTLVNKY